MDKNTIYELVKETVRDLARDNDLFPRLPDLGNGSDTLESIGLDPLLLPDILKGLKERLGGRDLTSTLSASATLVTLDDLLGALSQSLGHGIPAPTMVYVDDEDANLFVFKRRFGKHFTIRYFSNPSEALDFILKDPTVALVLTDEVMPIMTGNELCDKVHALKPAVKFILLTGNPNNQDDLLYQTMRRNRFYEFLQKPLDIENRFDEILNLFASILETDGIVK